MASIADRALETTNTTGTGTLTLAGAVAGYQSFSSAFATGTQVEYVILSGTDWEVGTGFYTTAGTTLTRVTIRRSSNSGNAITVAAGARVWADLGADNITGLTNKFRNRVLNGDFLFDELNGAALVTSSGGIGAQSVDGWTVYGAGGGTVGAQRVADPDFSGGFALKLTVSVADVSIAANDLYQVYQAIEGFEVIDLKAGTASAEQITVSFDMKFSVTGQYGIFIQNSAINRFYVGTVTQNVANATEHKEVTLTLDTSGTWNYTTGAGLYVGFTLACGSTYQGTAGAWGASQLRGTVSQANFMSNVANVGYLMRFQVEKGRVSTPFERVPIPHQKERIGRYYQKSGSAADIYRTDYGAASLQCVYMPFTYRMIAAPTMLVTSATYNLASGAGFFNIGDRGAEMIFSSGGAGSYVFLAWSANARIS